MSSLSVFVYTWLLTLTNGNGFFNAQKGVCVLVFVCLFIHLSWWSGKLSELGSNFDVIELLGSFLTNFLFCFCLFILTYLLCPSFTYRFFTFSASSCPSFLATRASRWGCRCGRKGQSAVTENLSGCHAHFHPFQTIPVTIWYTFADCCCCGLSHIQRKVVIEYSSHTITFYSNCIHVQFVVFVRERI